MERHGGERRYFATGWVRRRGYAMQARDIYF
jgi:hypothetical protein